MKNSIRIFALALLASVVAMPASATVIVYGYEDGSDVIFSGGGSLDLTGLASPGSADFTGGVKGRVQAVGPWLLFLDAALDLYSGAASAVASVFGTGTIFDADIVSGDAFGFENALLVTPDGYVSGGALTASMTFLNQDFASMGLVAGTYTWTLTNDDTFRVEIGRRPVPEPSVLALLGLGLAGLGFSGRKSS